jgi:hypothetical protein
MKSEKAKHLLWVYQESLFSTFIKNYKYPERQFGGADGWYSIISEICGEVSNLQAVTSLRTKANIKFDVQQIKEKFGTLRFYYRMSIESESGFSILFRKINGWLRMNMCKRGFYKKYWVLDKFRRKRIYETLYEKVENIVNRGEFKSSQTCEVCGSDGKGCSPNGWLLTLCEKHEKETEKGEE